MSEPVSKQEYDVHNQGTRELFGYWNRLRAGNAAPKRREIEPMDIRKHLADTFILESGLRKGATFRLAGTRICAIFGRELKNFSFYSLFDQTDATMMDRAVSSCFNAKSVTVLRLSGTSRTKRILDLECVLLPLENDNEGQRLFGAIFAIDAPYWVGADIIEHCKVVGVRVVDPSTELVDMNTSSSMNVPSIRPSLNELHRQPEHMPLPLAQGRRVGHLTVITGGLPSPTES